MGIAKRNLTYELNERTVDGVSEEIAAVCEEAGTSGKDAARYRISVEECLLGWLERGGKGAKVTLETGAKLFLPYVDLTCEGTRHDPLADLSGDFGPYAKTVLVDLGLSPAYSYADGVNRVRFRIRRKGPGSFQILLLMFLLAAAVGAAGLQFLPEGVRSMVDGGFIAPVYDTFFKLISMFAGPMVFLSVAIGIYGSGDAATFGRIGEKMVLTYVPMAFAAALAGLAFAPLIGPGLAPAAAGSSQFSEILEMITGIVPENIVQPFLDGNTLQIIFMAVAFGLGLLFLGKQTETVARGIDQLNSLVRFLMSFLCRLFPFLIFFIVVHLIWSDSLGGLMHLWQVVAAHLPGSALLVLIYLLYTSASAKASPFVILRKMMPTYLIALATASSAASFESNCRTCRDDYGIDGPTVNYGIPLGMVMQKMTTSMYFVVIVLFMAKLCGFEGSVSWYAMAVIVCATVSIAMPPIPGGAVVAYTVIFAQFGIPEEMLSAVIALDMITDFYITAADMACLQLSMINIGRRTGMIDLNKLRAPKK